MSKEIREMINKIKFFINENVGPQRVTAYHVSSAVFDKFDTNTIGSNDLHLKKGKDKHGFFFTKSQWDVDSMVNVHKRYGKPSIVYTCELTFNNPYTLEDFSKNPVSQFNTSNDGWNIFDRNTETIIEDVFRLNKDAVYFGDFIVVFKPSQINIIKIDKT